MTEFVPKLNLFTDTFSRQRHGMVWCLHPTREFREPQYGQQMPVGQRWSMNQDSAFASSRNLCKSALVLGPCRCIVPGELFVIFMPYMCTKVENYSR